MPKNTVIRATIDEEVKKQSMTVLKGMGLTMSDAIRILFAHIAMEKTLPFMPLRPNGETLAAMQDAEIGNLESFDTVEELFEDLDA